MILDRENLFSDGQAVTSTAASTDYIDLGVDRDIGIGNELELLISVDTAVTADGSATVTFALQTDNASTFDTGPTTLWASSAIGKATLVAGYQIKVRVPRGTDRYLRVNYTVATGPLTAGAFTAGILLDVDDQVIYAKGAQVLA